MRAAGERGRRSFDGRRFGRGRRRRCALTGREDGRNERSAVVGRHVLHCQLTACRRRRVERAHRSELTCTLYRRFLICNASVAHGCIENLRQLLSSGLSCDQKHIHTHVQQCKRITVHARILWQMFNNQTGHESGLHTQTDISEQLESRIRQYAHLYGSEERRIVVYCPCD